LLPKSPAKATTKLSEPKDTNFFWKNKRCRQQRMDDSRSDRSENSFMDDSLNSSSEREGRRSWGNPRANDIGRSMRSSELMQARVEKGKEALKRLLAREHGSETQEEERMERIDASSFRRESSSVKGGGERLSGSSIDAESFLMRKGFRGPGLGDREAAEEEIGSSSSRPVMKRTSGQGCAPRLSDESQEEQNPEIVRLYRKVKSMDEHLQLLYDELTESRQLNEDLKDELRRRDLEEGDQRAELIREADHALKVRDDAVSLFEKTLQELESMETRFMEEGQAWERSRENLNAICQASATRLKAEVELREQVQKGAEMLMEQVSQERSLRENITDNLREELDSLRAELSTTQAQWQKDVQTKQSQSESLESEKGALEQERSARQSLQHYLESVVTSLVRDTKSMGEEAKVLDWSLQFSSQEAAERISHLQRENTTLKTNLKTMTQEVGNGTKQLVEQAAALSKELDTTRDQLSMSEAKSRQQVSTLAGRNQTLQSTAQIASERASRLKGHLLQRDQVLKRTLERMERLAAVHAEQGGLGTEWESESRMLKRNIETLDDFNPKSVSPTISFYFSIVY